MTLPSAKPYYMHLVQRQTPRESPLDRHDLRKHVSFGLPIDAGDFQEKALGTVCFRASFSCHPYLSVITQRNVYCGDTKYNGQMPLLQPLLSLPCIIVVYEGLIHQDNGRWLPFFLWQRSPVKPWLPPQLLQRHRAILKLSFHQSFFETSFPWGIITNFITYQSSLMASPTT